MDTTEKKLTATGFTSVQIDETLRETISHGTPDYPFRFYDENMDMFDFRCIDWHWHSELEFMLVEEGTVECFVGTDPITLSPGCAIFINTKVIHKFTSEQNATTPNFLFSPAFISSEDSLIYKKYILPILHCSAKYQIFNPLKPEHKKILQIIESIIQVQRKEEFVELKTNLLLLELWEQIFKITDLSKKILESENTIRGQGQLQMMMQFIQQNYSEDITLEEIAQSVNVSKSTALNIFAKYLNDTPVNYLIAYRLKKAAKLLKATENKISFIAQETGFETDAYFCRCFKKYFGITPSMYRLKGGIYNN